MAEYRHEKYYWIKLPRTFFDNYRLKVLEGLPNGCQYEIIYLKMMLQSANHEGELRLSEAIPYNVQMLSSITGMNEDTVRSALDALKELGLIEIWDDGTFYLESVKGLVGATTEGAEKKAQQRKRQDELPPGENDECIKGDICPPDVHPEVDKGVDTEVDKRGKSVHQSIRDKSTREEELKRQELKNKELSKVRIVAQTTRDVVDYLNERVGTSYKPTADKTKRCVEARLGEGFTLDDFKRVIDRKADEWLADPEMARFLRPETLFGPKFEGYLNAPEPRKQGGGAHDASEYTAYD